MARILIVDDDSLVGGALGRLLAGIGHECTYAADASHARHQLQTSRFELMLCDINMPGESGIELARHVLKERTDDVAVVMATGVDDADVAETALELGAYGYLIKPAGRNDHRFERSAAAQSGDRSQTPSVSAGESRQRTDARASSLPRGNDPTSRQSC